MLILPLLVAAAPIAFTGADITDAQCVAAFSLAVDGASRSDDAAAKQSLAMGAIYFVGKLKGRNPTLDLEAILRTVSAGVTKNSASTLQRCVVEFRTVGQDMITIGRALSASGL